MQTVLISGGTGMVGKRLAALLMQKGYAVIILTRKIPVSDGAGDIKYALWDVQRQTIDKEALQNADHIIHLAGAGVMDKKWTEEYKKEIIDSRVKSARLIIGTLKTMPHKVQTMVSASAIGYYGEDTPAKGPFEETALPDKNFLGEVCRLWEESVEPAKALGIRLVKLRIGIVLGKDDGALKEFVQPLKFGIATVLGNGKQMMSWIHLDDLCRLFLYAVQNEQLHDVYNAVAPIPVSNKILISTLAKKRNGKFYLRIPVPAFILQMIMGGRSIEILKSATVSSKKIEAAGFQFKYGNIEAALEQILND